MKSRKTCTVLTHSMLMSIVFAGCNSQSEIPIEAEPFSTEMMSDSTPFITPGIREPAVIAAADATIGDDAEVIGITVGDHSRAYLVKAMSGMTTHVANDVVNAVPVSITYCDRTDFARAFALPESDTVVDLGVQGWVDGEMSLTLGTQSYRHSSPEIPLEDYPLERTSWGDWKSKHPDTELVESLDVTAR